MDSRINVKDVVLVNMPFANLNTPSLGLSLLRATLDKENISCEVRYENIQFAEVVGIDKYILPDIFGLTVLAGEWVFSEAAGFMPGDFSIILKYITYRDYLEKEKDEIIADLISMKDAVENFLDNVLASILNKSPKIVGFTSVYQQNNACFALLRKIKKAAPSIITVIGGSNCALDMGVAISQEIDFVDFVFSGECEDVFADFCKTLMEKGRNVSLEALPYGVIRKGKFSSQSPPYYLAKNLNLSPIPNYTDYMDVISKSPISEKTTVSMLVEGSRGCWWRDTFKCKFCGLSVGSSKYRDKDTYRLVEEIAFLKQAYQISRFTFSDNIMSKRHFKELPKYHDKLGKVGLFSEINPNVDKQSIRSLRKIGFNMMQPGIESLHDDSLRLMNKGGSAIYNIALLKHSRSYGVLQSWNILIGATGEEDRHIGEIIKRVRKLTHLQPPQVVTHIMYHKHSIYVDDAENYGLKLQAVPANNCVYFGNPELSDNLAYCFEPVSSYEQEGYYSVSKKGKIYEELVDLIKLWRQLFFSGKEQLSMLVYDDRIEISDYRMIAKKSSYILINEIKDVFLACDEPIEVSRLNAKLVKYTKDEIDIALNYLIEADLVIEINEHVLALASELTGYGYITEIEDFPLGWTDI